LARFAAIVNGVPDASLSVADRGLLYGDGVFRTFRAYKGLVNAWRRHFDKLSGDCARLGIGAPSRQVLEEDLAQALRAAPDAVVKIIVTRGAGPRGYAPPKAPSPTRIVSTAPLPQYPSGWAGGGIKVRVCDVKLSLQPRLAGVKHLNRLENVLARAEWDGDQFGEGLMLDCNCRVIAGTMSNIFVWSKATLATPALELCGVAGVTRDRVLDFARASGIRAEVRELGLEEVLAADEVFLTNSVIGAWRVRELGDRRWEQAEFTAVVRQALERHED
jgi:4-amino-4-deoxychorismate lyase